VTLSGSGCQPSLHRYARSYAFSDRCAAKRATLVKASRRAAMLVRQVVQARSLRTPYTSSLIGGYIHVCRDPKGERPAFLLIRGHMVGLGGLEPPASSLSGIEG
jgi:hypothetical protein